MTWLSASVSQPAVRKQTKAVSPDHFLAVVTLEVKVIRSI